MKAVIFDMDGILIDSERPIFDVYVELAEQKGLKGMAEAVCKCIGTTMQTTRKLMLGYFGDEETYMAFFKEANDILHERFPNHSYPLKPGVVELLTYLKENGYVIGLASSTRREVVEEITTNHGISSFFQTLTCGDMVAKSKPEPDIFLKACENVGVAPKDAYAIEDSYNGIRAAYRAGMTPIMVPDMVAPDEEMRELAAYIFEDLHAVKEWMEQNK